MMLCAKNYCNLLIFGRVFVKIKRGAFFETVYIVSGGALNSTHSLASIERQIFNLQLGFDNICLLSSDFVYYVLQKYVP